MTAKMPRLTQREETALKFVKRRARVSSEYWRAHRERADVEARLDMFANKSHPSKEVLRARRAELNDIIDAYQAKLLCLDNDALGL